MTGSYAPYPPRRPRPDAGRVGVEFGAGGRKLTEWEG